MRPRTKNVALTSSWRSAVRNCGVERGSGPSSKVSATCVRSPRPARAGSIRRRNGVTLVSAGPACSATSDAAPAAARWPITAPTRCSVLEPGSTDAVWAAAVGEAVDHQGGDTAEYHQDRDGGECDQHAVPL